MKRLDFTKDKLWTCQIYCTLFVGAKSENVIELASFAFDQMQMTQHQLLYSSISYRYTYGTIKLVYCPILISVNYKNRFVH